MKTGGSQITVAVTVYDRRTYVRQAIASALNQTVPVRVMVVEDCGPDPGMQAFIQAEFGTRIEYVRNPDRRGLFDNWNSCIELCRTPWLCILHDDDYLEPVFAASMLELMAKFPGKGLYYGNHHTVDASGRILEAYREKNCTPAEEMDLERAARIDPVPFPTQLMNVAQAKALGGFRKTSLYTGDWELWFKLAVKSGAARTGTVVASYRDHFTDGRGTVRIDRVGKRYGLIVVQHKRNLALLERSGRKIRFDREFLFRESPIPARYLLRYSRMYSKRLLCYHWRLFVVSGPRTPASAALRLFCRVFGPSSLRMLSYCSAVRWR